MAKAIFHLQGLVRRVEVKRKNEDDSIYGVSLSVLSEPDGDTVEVTAFTRDLPTEQAEALKGQSVHLLVSPSARAGSRGGAFLDVTLVSVVGILAEVK